MDGIANTIVTDIEETIKKYNLDCSVKVNSFHISSPNERNKIILALSENGDIVQKWMCIYKNGCAYTKMVHGLRRASLYLILKQTTLVMKQKV